MTATTYQTGASDTFARLGAYIGQLVEGAREGRQIEARYRELSRLSRVDLARRGLNRQTVAHAALTEH